LAKLPSLKERFNIAPSQKIAILRGDATDLENLSWGLIPSWAKDKKMAFINARSETAAEKPAFRSSFKKYRCLILSDGFYEWKKVGTQKQPFYIHLKSENPFAMAGLWSHWTSPEGEIIETVSILTTEANKLMKDIHHRMPVIMNEKDYKTWLNPNENDKEKLKSLLSPFDSTKMKAYPVSTYVNKPQNSDSKCIEPDDN